MNMYKNHEGYSDPTVGAAYSRMRKSERPDRRGNARKPKYRRRYSREHNGGTFTKRPPKKGNVLKRILAKMKKAGEHVTSFYRKEKQHGR